MRDKKYFERIAHDTLLTAKKTGSAACDVAVGSGESMEIVFEENKLKLIKSSATTTVDLRVVAEGRLGVAATNIPSPLEIAAISKDAVEVSRFGKVADFSLPKKVNFSSPKLYDSEVAKMADAKLIAKGKEIISKVNQIEPEMRVNSLEVSRSFGESYFANSNGVEDHEKQSLIAFGLELSRVLEGDFFQVYSGNTSRKFDLDVDGIVESVLEKVEWGRKITKVKSGKYPLIIAPETADTFVSYFLVALSGKSVNEKNSKFEGKLGRKLFDKRLTIIDNPTLNWGIGSYGLDDEGVTGRKKYLIKNGQVESFYYDLSEAAKAQVESTGSGVRRSFTQAEPAVSNIILDGGEKTYPKLLSGVKSGILVYQLLGGGMNNPLNGDFQYAINLGFWVENGTITGRVKNVGIAGNIFDLFRENLVWMSKVTETWGNCTSPYICLDNVVVTAK